MRPALCAILSLTAGSVYAVLRYHTAFFGSDGNDQLPAFLANKAISVAALLLLAVAVGARALSKLGRVFAGLYHDRRRIGITGFVLAVVHSALSLVLLTPSYLGKLYRPDGQMTWRGELSMLVGVVALVLLVWQSRLAPAGPHDDRRALRRLGLATLVLTAVHVWAMGYPAWRTPGDWPGGLPPITLWSFVIALVGLGLGVVPRARG